MCRDTMHRLEEFNKHIVAELHRPVNLILIDDDYKSSALEMLATLVTKMNDYNMKRFGPSAPAFNKQETESLKPIPEPTNDYELYLLIIGCSIWMLIVGSSFSLYIWYRKRHRSAPSGDKE